MSYQTLLASLEEADITDKLEGGAAADDVIKTDGDVEEKLEEGATPKAEDADVVEHKGEGAGEEVPTPAPTDGKEDDVELQQPQDTTVTADETNDDIAIVEDTVEELEEIQESVEAMKEAGADNVPAYARKMLFQRMEHITKRTGLPLEVDGASNEDFNDEAVASLEAMVADTLVKVKKWLEQQVKKLKQFLVTAWRQLNEWRKKVFSRSAIVQRKVKEGMPEADSETVKVEQDDTHSVVTYREWAESVLSQPDNLARIQALSFYKGENAQFTNLGESLVQSAESNRKVMNGISRYVVAMQTENAKGFPGIRATLTDEATGRDVTNASSAYFTEQADHFSIDYDAVLSPSGVRMAFDERMGFTLNKRDLNDTADRVSEDWLNFLTNKKAVLDAMATAQKVVNKTETNVFRSIGSVDKIFNKLDVDTNLGKDASFDDVFKVYTLKEFVKVVSSAFHTMQKAWAACVKDYAAFDALCNQLVPKPVQ